MSFFYTESYANSTIATPSTTASEGGFMSFAPLIAIFAIFYFLLIRPQQKKYKEQQAMIDALKKGDKVVTSGGIVGIITDIQKEENIIELEIAKEVVIKVTRGNVSTLVADKKSAVKKLGHHVKDKHSKHAKGHKNTTKDE
jgi:preprotein translocase subunit YajC